MPQRWLPSGPPAGGGRPPPIAGLTVFEVTNTNGKLLVVSTFADGPYFPSALEILTPPVGCSFYRTFDYRKEWVDDELHHGVAPETVRAFEAIVGMRFQRPDPAVTRPEHTRFVPLRFANVQVYHDDAYVHFALRMDEYVPLSKGTADLEHWEVEPRQQFNDHGGAFLAWLATAQDRSSIDRLGRQNSPDGKLWAVLAKSDRLSAEARANFRGAVVPVAKSLFRQADGVPIEPTEVEQSPRGSVVYGYDLRVDQRVGVELETRRIIEVNAPDAPEAPDFEFMTSPELVRPTAASVPFTGNYRQTAIYIQPRVIVDGRTDLHWAPRYRSNKPRERRDIDLRIPFKASGNWPVLPILLALIGLLGGVVLIFDDVSDATRSAAQAVGVTLIAAGVGFVNRAFEDVRRQK